MVKKHFPGKIQGTTVDLVDVELDPKCPVPVVPLA
jgi:hypothetical protein